jgi:hypothetical protein
MGITAIQFASIEFAAQHGALTATAHVVTGSGTSCFFTRIFGRWRTSAQLARESVLACVAGKKLVRTARFRGWGLSCVNSYWTMIPA